jgi:hypothetical protein
MVPWHWSHFTPEVCPRSLTSRNPVSCLCTPTAKHEQNNFSQVFKIFARSALRDIDVLGDSYRYDPTRFSRSFCGGIVTILCFVATIGIIAASSYQFHTSPRVFMPAERKIVFNSLAFELSPGSNTSSRIALSDFCDLPPMTYTVKITVKHFESFPTQIRRVTVIDQRKYGMQTEESDIKLSSSEMPTAPNFAHSSALAVPLGSFNDFAQASPFDTSFSVADQIASKASRSITSKVIFNSKD